MNEEFGILFLVAGALVISAYVAAYLAETRNRDGSVWFLIALVFGPLAWLAIFAGKPRNS